MEDTDKILIDKLSESRFDMLKNRSKRCVCKYCGGKLRLRKIIFSNMEDSKIELFCTDCDRIEFGVEREVYQSAAYYVDSSKFNCYPDMDENQLTRQMSIAKVAEIITWGTQNFGFLEEDGFTAPLQVNRNFFGDSIILSDDDLFQETEKE